MKKTIIVIIAFFFASFTMSAQVVVNASGFDFRGGSFYRNGEKLTPEQLCNVIGQQAFDNQYKPGKGLRVAGITCLSVGGAAVAGGAACFIVAGVSNETKELFNVIPGTFLTIGGAVIAATGGVLLGVGNSKLKRIKPASSGVGASLSF